MSFKYQTPDEAQTKLLVENGICPESLCVVRETEGSVTFKNYSTGCEIKVSENVEKKNRRDMGW